MCRSFVVIMQTFKSQPNKSTCTHYPVDNKWCLANYMIALKIYSTIQSECIVLFLFQNFLTKAICKVYTTKPFFSGPILCKLGTNRPFVKWISVSLNKASHSNRNYSKVQNKRGRGLKLVLNRHFMLLHSGYIGIIHCPTYFFLWLWMKGGWSIQN